ncbi:heterokaryon incompatibility protein-domain-containing protein [Xylariaceae sp. FL1019]|nr:heterokaryon incompatibility protein-domain-containing protein [Xylariaceae sp. FL1019]
MRLLNTKTFKLEDFLSAKGRPKYAILSHTWNAEEVLYAHVKSCERAELEKVEGFAKLKASCAQAQSDGYEFIWVDTCCIDKSSSAELSEAINSMWAWYRQSDVCYGFLADVKKGDEKSVRRSRWFTRGWTLQELIAPERLRFFDKNWSEMDDRIRMAPILSQITGIDQDVLTRNHRHSHTHAVQPHNLLCVVCGLPTSIDEILRKTSVSVKMSWSAHRETTRGEDRSYCLLGLFGLNMPLLYGEGQASAWIRLLTEIMKRTKEQSILAFDNRPKKNYMNGQVVLASSTPFDGGIFAESSRQFMPNVQLPETSQPRYIELVGDDLVLDAWVCSLVPKDPENASVSRFWDDTKIGLLDCKIAGESMAWPAIVLRSVPGSSSKFIRLRENLLKVDAQDPPTVKACRELRESGQTMIGLDSHKLTYDLGGARLRRITITTKDPIADLETSNLTKPLRILAIKQPESFKYKLDSSFPKAQGDYIEKIPVFWSGKHKIMGMAIFSNQNKNPFMITWGPEGSDKRSLWCKISRLPKLEHSDYSACKDDLAATLRSKAWKDNRSLRLEDFGIDYRLHNKDGAVLGDIYLSIEIRDVKVLDREIWQLSINISPARRREKNDGKWKREDETRKENNDTRKHDNDKWKQDNSQERRVEETHKQADDKKH